MKYVHLKKLHVHRILSKFVRKNPAPRVACTIIYSLIEIELAPSFISHYIGKLNLFNEINEINEYQILISFPHSPVLSSPSHYLLQYTLKACQWHTFFTS